MMFVFLKTLNYINKVSCAFTYVNTIVSISFCVITVSPVEAHGLKTTHF